MYFPNLLELSFLFVRALPKLSKIALDFRRISLVLLEQNVLFQKIFIIPPPYGKFFGLNSPSPSSFPPPPPTVNSILASYFPLEMMGIAAILTCTQTLYFVLSSLRETTNKSINHRGFEKTLGNTWGCSRGKTKIETSPSPLKFPMTFSKVGMDVFWNCTTYSKDNITITFNYYSLY